MATTTITAKANPSRKRASAVRSGRLGLRTTPAQAALIERAAAATRKSVTEFVLSSVCEKAEQTLLDQRLFIVDEQTWLSFQDTLERPVQVKKGFQRSGHKTVKGRAMDTINIHEAKTHLSRLVEEAAQGKAFIIAKAGKPLVKVSPLSMEERRAGEKLGFMAGEISVPDDFDSLGASEIK